MGVILGMEWKEKIGGPGVRKRASRALHHLIHTAGKLALKVEPDRRGNGSRRDIVSAAERRKEVVERFFVRQIDDRQAGAPPVLVGVEDIVVSDGGVEEIARRDTGRVVVIVLRACSGNGYQCGTVHVGGAESCGADRHGGRCVHRPAIESPFELLIGRKA